MVSVEERIKILEFQVELLQRLANPSIDPFAYLVLENKFSRQQHDDILGHMDAFTERVINDVEISRAEFERIIYNIVPRDEEDYHLPESIVRTLKDSGRYEEVYRRMKELGMNL